MVAYAMCLLSPSLFRDLVFKNKRHTGKYVCLPVYYPPLRLFALDLDALCLPSPIPFYFFPVMIIILMVRMMMAMYWCYSTLHFLPLCRWYVRRRSAGLPLLAICCRHDHLLAINDRLQDLQFLLGDPDSLRDLAFAHPLIAQLPLDSPRLYGPFPDGRAGVFAHPVQADALFQPVP